MGRNDEAIAALQRSQDNDATAADVAIVLDSLVNWVWPEAQHSLISRPTLADNAPVGALHLGALMEGLTYEITHALERAETLVDAAARLEPQLPKHATPSE